MRHGFHSPVPASPEFVRLFLSGLAWDAAQSGRPLIALLEIASRGRLVDSPRGKILASTAADGAPVTIALPPRGRLRGCDLAKIAAQLVERARAILFSAPETHDDGLKGALLKALREKQPARGRPRHVNAALPPAPA